MKHDNSGNDRSSPRQWKRMSLVVARKTEVIARCRRRSDAESHALMLCVKSVKP